MAKRRYSRHRPPPVSLRMHHALLTWVRQRAARKRRSVNYVLVEMIQLGRMQVDPKSISDKEVAEAVLEPNDADGIGHHHD